MLLLVLIMIYNGLSQSFFVGVMPPRMGKKVCASMHSSENVLEIFICVQLLGFVMASFGASCAVGGFFFGKLSDLMPRKWIFFISFLLSSIGLALSSLSSSEKPWLFFLAMITLGFGDAALQTQTSSVLGSFQPQKTEAAFGCKY